MKITRISTVVVNANMRNWIFVKVETDDPGLHGWGEATLEWKTAGIVGAIEDIGRYVLTGAVIVIPIWLLTRLASARR